MTILPKSHLLHVTALALPDEEIDRVPGSASPPKNSPILAGEKTVLRRLSTKTVFFCARALLSFFMIRARLPSRTALYLIRSIQSIPSV